MNDSHRILYLSGKSDDKIWGWHGTLSKDEHIKYARLSSDIDPGLDDEFRITVNKSKVEFPEILFQHLKTRVNPTVTRKRQKMNITRSQNQSSCK